MGWESKIRGADFSHNIKWSTEATENLLALFELTIITKHVCIKQQCNNNGRGGLNLLVLEKSPMFD